MTVGLATFLCLSLSSGADSSVPGERILAATSTSVPFDRVYGLGVVDVPEPPADLAERGEAAALATCPVEVRAIVRGDSPATTFTVVARNGQSMLLAAGEGVKTPDGWLTVSKIASDHVVIRRGGEAHRCEFKPDAADERRNPAR